MGWVPGVPLPARKSPHFLGYSRGIPLRGERLPLILQGKLADSTNAPLAARPAEAREATETRHFPVSAATHTSGARTIPGSYAALRLGAGLTCTLRTGNGSLAFLQSLMNLRSA